MHVPMKLDFSSPSGYLNSYRTRTSAPSEAIEAQIAGLMVQERCIQDILQETLDTSDAATAGQPKALAEFAAVFKEHYATLGALSSRIDETLHAHAERVRSAFTEAGETLAANFTASLSSYGAKLHEMYLVASAMAVAYVSLETTAQAHGDVSVAAVAARHLQHTGQLLLALHDLVRR